MIDQVKCLPQMNEHHATEVAIVKIVQDVVGKLNQQGLTRPVLSEAGLFF